MPFLLHPPFLKSLFRLRKGETSRVGHHACIFTGCCPVDEQVVVAGMDSIMRGKSFVLVKERFPVSHVPSHTHVWNSREGKGEILQGYVDGIKTDQSVQQAVRLLVGSISNDNLYLF